MSIFAMLDPRNPVWNLVGCVMCIGWILWIGRNAPDV